MPCIHLVYLMMKARTERRSVFGTSGTASRMYPSIRCEAELFKNILA